MTGGKASKAAMHGTRTLFHCYVFAMGDHET